MRVADEIGPAGEPCARCPYVLVERVEPTVVPAWVLPFLRLRAATGGDTARAWSSLPAALPVGITCPDLDEAAAVLYVFGLA